MVLVQQPASEISLQSMVNSHVMFSNAINVYDSDESPYNNFKCKIENDNRFSLVYDNYKRTVNFF
jgi:hypothetical protein